MSNSNIQTFNHTSLSFLEQAKQQAQNGIFGNKQKKMFFQFISEIVNNQFPFKVYLGLIILEHLQIIAYLTHSTIQYTSVGISALRFISNFINPQYFLRTIPNTMNILIPISLIIVIIHFSLFIIAYIKHRNQSERNQLQKVNSKKSKIILVIHWMNIFVCTILTIPIAFPSVNSIYCSEADLYNTGHSCYKTFHMFLVLSSIWNLIWLIFIHIIFSMFYFNRNPFSRDIFSMSSPLWNFVKFLVKIIPTAYTLLDPKFGYTYVYLFGIPALYVIYIAFGRSLYPYQRYNKQIQTFTIYIETISTIIGIIFFIQLFFHAENEVVLLFLSSLIISFPLGKLFCKLVIDRKQQTLQKLNETSKQNCQQIQKFLIYLIYDIQENYVKKKTNINKQVPELLKIVKYHNDQCQNCNCHCHDFINNYTQHSSNIQLFYKILIDIIDKLIQQNRRAYSLIILKSQIQFFKLKNVVRASYALSKILYQKTNIFQDYLIVALLYEYNKLAEDNSNMEKYRIFSTHLRQFEREVIKMAIYYQQYWLQLIQQNSSLQKIMKLLQEAYNSKQIIQKQHTGLVQIYPNNIRVAQVYKQMQKEVLLNLYNFIKYQNLYKEFVLIEKQQQLLFYDPKNRIKFTSNQDLVVITSKISDNGNAGMKSDIFNGGCEIINITHNIDKILGYFYKDLIGKNINRFLPKVYTKFHDKFIEQYLNQQKSQIRPKQITVYPLNSQGYIVETVLLNKVMPSLDYGVVIISFIECPKQTSQTEYLIIYDKNTGLIDSMSEKAQKLLLGKKNKNNSISIPDHINDILPMWDTNKQEYIRNRLGSQKDLHENIQNITLKQSDGPQQDKYAKVIHFQLQYNSMMFSFNENQISAQLSEYIFGYQTLMQNADQKQSEKFAQINQIIQKQKIDLLKNQDKIKDIQISYNSSQICETSKPLLSFSPKNNIKLEENYNNNIHYRSDSQSRLKDTVQKSKSNKKGQKINEEFDQIVKLIPSYVNYFYILFQLLIVLGLLSLLLYQFLVITNRSDDFNNNIVIKHQIQDCQLDLIDLSNYLSQYLYATANYSTFLSTQVDPINLQSSLASLQAEIDVLFKQLILKQSQSILNLKNYYINVSYFNGPTSITYKTKLFTDASYQFISYYLDVLSTTNFANSTFNPVSLASLYNDNILYIFKNANQISQVFQQLNKDFTNYVQSFLQSGKRNIDVFIALLITLLFLSVVIKTAFQSIVLKRLNKVMHIYEYIPIFDIQKFPKKCQNFIKFVCPQQQITVITKAVKTIHDLGEHLISQKQKEKEFNNDEQKSLILQGEIQFISFSQAPSIFYALLKNVMYIFFLVMIGIIFGFVESSNLNDQLNTISEWDSLTEIRDKLSKIAYFSNQYISYGNQWNLDQISLFKKELIHNLETLDQQITITSSKTLNSYEISIYSLIQQFRYLVNNPKGIDMQKFFINQQKILNMSAQLINVYVKELIQNTTYSQNESNNQYLQIFLIVQLLYLAFFVWSGLWKQYKKYFKIYQTSIKMYQTLGNKLQNIGIKNYRIEQQKRLKKIK